MIQSSVPRNQLLLKGQRLNCETIALIRLRLHENNFTEEKNWKTNLVKKAKRDYLINIAFGVTAWTVF